MNNKILVMMLIFPGCNLIQNDHNDSDLHHPNIKIADKSIEPAKESNKSLNVKNSIIQWKGTKFIKSGKHEGTVMFKSGEIIMSDHQLIGGNFTADMRSIYITDIPLTDPIPRKILTTHLNSDFETDVYPEASFFIIEVNESIPASYSVTGELTIKNISRTITIKVREIEPGKKFSASFSINRFDWKIGENGSWLEKKLVDANIFLEVFVATN